MLIRSSPIRKTEKVLLLFYHKYSQFRTRTSFRWDDFLYKSAENLHTTSLSKLTGVFFSSWCLKELFAIYVDVIVRYLTRLHLLPYYHSKDFVKRLSCFCIRNTWDHHTCIMFQETRVIMQSILNILWWVMLFGYKENSMRIWETKLELFISVWFVSGWLWRWRPRKFMITKVRLLNALWHRSYFKLNLTLFLPEWRN